MTCELCKENSKTIIDLDCKACLFRDLSDSVVAKGTIGSESTYWVVDVQELRYKYSTSKQE